MAKDDVKAASVWLAISGTIDDLTNHVPKFIRNTPPRA